MCVLLAATVEPRMVLREAYSMGCSMVWGPGDSQGAVGEPVTAEQVDELVLELVGVLGEYYTKRMHFLGDFPYLAAALGDPSPAARQRGASRVLQYLSATGPGLAMENDPLQLYKLQADLQELEATGIITEPLEQLLSRYFRPVHITNAASETALKPLNNDMVLSMKEEGVSGRIKMTVEDTNSWFSDYLSDDALGAAASDAGALGGEASHAGALGAAASPAAARGAAASPAAALGAAASPTGALGAAASPHGAQGAAATKPVQAAKQTSQARKVLRAMQRITLPVKLPTREEYSSAASARDQNNARQQRLADITNKLQHLEDTARQMTHKATRALVQLGRGSLRGRTPAAPAASVTTQEVTSTSTSGSHDTSTGARETAPGADAAASAMCGLTTEVKDAMHTLTQLLDEHVKRKSTRTRLLHMFFNGKPVMRRRAALKLANPTITKWLMHKTTQAKQLVRAYVQAVELDIAANQDSSMEDMPDAAQQPPPAPASAAPAATSAAPQATPAPPASAAQQPAAAAAATRLTQLRPAAVMVPPNTTTHDRINHLEQENRSLKQRVRTLQAASAQAAIAPPPDAQVDALQQQLIAVQARLADKEAACLKLQQQANNYKAKALPLIAKENLAKVTVSISRLEAERAAAQASAAQLLQAGSSLSEVSAALDRINTDLAKQRQAKLHYEKSPDFDAATQYVFEQAQLQAKEPLAAEQAARQAAEEQLGNTQQQLHEAQVFIEHLERQVADERQQRERAQNDLAQLRADEKAASQRLQQLRRQISVHKATIASDKTGLLAIVTNNYDHLRVTERITPDRVHDPAFQERVAMCLVDEQLLGPVPRNTPPGQAAQQHEDMAIDPDDMSGPDPVQEAAPGVGSADVAQQAGTSRPRPPKPTFEPLPPPGSIMPEEYRVVPEERERYFTTHFAPQLHAMRKDYDLSITRFNADEAWNYKAMGFGADYSQWQSLMCRYATKASDPPQSKEQSHKPHTVKTGLPAKFSGASGQFAEMPFSCSLTILQAITYLNLTGLATSYPCLKEKHCKLGSP
ncbi:hypothetical protein QJQ45_008136 [Haematococcus lacustris]|nr:hypothetical protein QJQ45_008136 [Haematococcus lacustris]